MEGHLLPQLKHVVAETFRAVKEVLAPTSSTRYESFQLFGFDFMLDDQFHLWLLEVNATPAAAQALLPDLVADLIATAIDSHLTPVVPKSPGGAAPVTASHVNLFKRIM